jgi:hypothetical protein
VSDAPLAELGRFGAVEAEIVAGRLAAEGIETVASGRGVASLYPLPLALFVAPRDLPAARRIIDEAAQPASASSSGRTPDRS